MKLRNKLLIFLLLFLICLPIIFAVQPSTNVQVSLVGETLTIIYPKHPSFVQYTNFTLEFHVFNSTAAIMEGDDVDCYIHIHNKTSNLEVDEQLAQSDHTWKITVPDKIANFTGIYPYTMHCNGTQNGYVSTTFEITKYGDNPDGNRQLYFILIIFVICYILLKLFAIIDEKHFLLKLLLFLFIIPILILLARNCMNLNSIGISVYKGMIWFVRCVFFYIAGYFIYEILKWRGIFSNEQSK